HEDAGPLAVGQEHGEALVLGEDCLQLAHLGRVVDDQPVADRDRQLEASPEVLGAAGEHGQPAGARAVDPALDVLLDALEVVAHRVVAGLVLPLAHGTEHAVEVDLVVVRTHVAPTVDVEVARGDRRRCPFEAGELAHDFLVENGEAGRCPHETRMCSTRAVPAAPLGGPPWVPATLAAAEAIARAWPGSFTMSSATSRKARAASMSSTAAACRCSTISCARSSFIGLLSPRGPRRRRT